jgi:hypothetical protein
MSSSTVSITESSYGVNPLPQQQPMWNRIMELQPLIRKCAVKMAFVYDEDAGDLEHDMMLALLDKSRSNPALLDKPTAYIFQTLKNLIHSAHRSKIEEYSLDDDFGWASTSSADLVACDDLESIEEIRFVLDHMNAECRELVKAILDNWDLVRDSQHKRNDRPCRNIINASALAGIVGRPERSVRRDVSRIRSKLVQLSLVFA